MTARPTLDPDDFPALFAAAPAALLVLRPDAPAFTIAAATDAYLRATLQTRDTLVGRPVFDALPDANPGDPAPTGVANLRASLETVLRTGAPHAMPVQRYDLRRPDGTWEERHWAPRNSPVAGADGAVRYLVHYVEDVTERVRAEQERARLGAEVAAERERLRAVLLQAPTPMALLVGPEHRFELLNDAYKRVSGGGRDLTGLTFREAYPELEGQPFFAIQDRAFATGEPWAASAVPVRYDRMGAGVEDAYFDLRYEPVRDAEGRVFALLNYGVDVTEQTRARREVERLLAESEAARQALEAANAQLQDQRLELERANRQLQNNAAELARQAEELRATAAELEERGAAAEDARQRTAAVLGSIADAFYLLDREWRFTHVNAAAEPLLQTTRERLLGRTLWEAFPDVIGSVFEGPYREAMATGRPAAAEAYFAPLGTWFDVRSYPWAGGLMVHFRDVGERKAAEAERERLLADAEAARAEADAARGRAEAASRAKSEFLAVMSHELRTPLNAIGGYAELIELGIRGPVTDQEREDLARIQRSQRALLGLINEVLNYARLETGVVTYDLADVPVAEAVAAAEVLVAPQLRAKGLGYAWAGADPGLAVRADRDKLQQILLNLLSNAVKFTNARAGRAGRVEVSAEAADEADNRAVRIRVRDTGVGIPADKLGAVFEPFVQVNAALTRTEEGGARARDQPRPRARDGRRPHGGEHGGRRQHVHPNVADGLTVVFAPTTDAS